jgi:hypothetical protein
MPAPDPSLLGPLAALIGTWEGDAGLDVSFHNEDGAVGNTPYRERVTFNPFGPVDNGAQHLYGLDYRMSAWRGDEEDPFHTEVGYWLWDGDARQVMRCFMVPRGSTVLAGGDADATSTTFTMRADVGSTTYGILSNRYLDEKARTVHYEVTMTVGDGTYSYEEDSVVELAATGSTIHHTDRNTMRKVD